MIHSNISSFFVKEIFWLTGSSQFLSLFLSFFVFLLFLFCITCSLSLSHSSLHFHQYLSYFQPSSGLLSLSLSNTFLHYVSLSLSSISPRPINTGNKNKAQIHSGCEQWMSHFIVISRASKISIVVITVRINIGRDCERLLELENQFRQ